MTVFVAGQNKGSRASSWRKYAVEKGCLLRLVPGLIDPGAVILTCFPVQPRAEVAQGDYLIGTSQGSRELSGSHVS